jgi:hypothetical protein
VKSATATTVAHSLLVLVVVGAVLVALALLGTRFRS